MTGVLRLPLIQGLKFLFPQILIKKSRILYKNLILAKTLNK
jgi:hypothetical protein